MWRGGGGAADPGDTGEAPTDVSATVENGIVKFDWTSTEAKYRVYYATESFANSAVANFNLLDGYKSIEVTEGLSAVVSGLTNGTPYYFVVTSVKDKIESVASDEEMATPSVTPTGKLNDSGITWAVAYDGPNHTTCESSVERDNVDKQDCSRGRDFTHNDDSDGLAGFNFTKLDIDGKVLPVDATSWSCVLDNITGLVWEVKTDDTSLRGKDETYSWGAGMQGYADSINAALPGLCGGNDWRIPTREELYGIIIPGQGIDKEFFPNTEPRLFWGAPQAGNDGFVSTIDFGEVSAGFSSVSDHPSTSHRVRLVRGSLSLLLPDGSSIRSDSWLDSRYTVHDLKAGDDVRTVTDNITGLMWKQCLEGQSGLNCDGLASTSWLDAVKFGRDDRTGGYDNWRLPNVKELVSLLAIDYAGDVGSLPYINNRVFPNTIDKGHWTSTPHPYKTSPLGVGLVWLFDFKDAVSLSLPLYNYRPTRLVRDIE